jgi:hypothetical protein
MRASKNIYHPNGDANDFQTVEATLDKLQFGSTAKLGGSTGSSDNRLLRSDGTGGKTVQASPVTVDDSGNMSGVGTLGATTVNASSDVQRNGASLAVRAQSWEQTITIEFPEDKDYPLFQNSQIARTITKVSSKCSTGTCTATVKIGSTALGGTANSVSSTEDVQAHSSDNDIAVGDDGLVTISSNSSAEMVVITISGTLVLA